MNSLAIVIPAYKPEFLDRALESIQAQTARDFHVYIGDDASPHDLEPIVEKWSRLGLPVSYTRFSANLGGHDLVAQWTRCIRLTQGEPWLWLFSDDDIMEPGCVAAFLSRIAADGERCRDIYHFDVMIIDSSDAIIKAAPPYPAIIRPAEYFRRKANASIESFVVENIFSRKIYNEVGGFKQFPMAWGSDVATWMAMMAPKGMATIKGPKVRWRSSNRNITPARNPEISRVKLLADIDLLSLAREITASEEECQDMKPLLARLLVHYCADVDKSTYCEAIDRALGSGIISVREAAILKHCRRIIIGLRRLRHAI